MWRVVLTVSLLCWDLCSSAITCKDKNGGEVDWYIMYKVPKLNNKALTGLEYFYIDPSKSEWISAINDPKGVLSNTLAPLLNWKTPMPTFGFISYNDQPSGCNAQKVFGHSKGVVMMDKTTGIWLFHSTPNFPHDRRQKILWPESGAQNGQTFMCATFKYSQFAQIGRHLQHIRAFPFDYDLPADFPASLQAVVKREDLKPKDSFLDQDLTSRGGQKFQSFAKYSSGSKNDEDLYFHVATKLNSDLSAQYWRGDADADPDCSQGGKVVQTIDYVEMTVTQGAKRVKASWTTCQDHSKWCIAKSVGRPWTCVVDLNRAYSQDKRPGGALCIERSQVRDAFKEFVEHEEDCPVRRF